MDEYISRNDAIEAVYRRICQIGLEADPKVLSIRQAIRDMPAADVRLVKRGKWLLFGKRGIYGVMYECSACHAKYDGRTSFCPNCGADMRDD